MHLLKNKKVITVGVGLLLVSAIGYSKLKSHNKDSLSSNGNVDQYRSVPPDPVQFIPGLNTKTDDVISDASGKIKVLNLTDENTVTFEDEVTYDSAKRVSQEIKKRQDLDRIYLVITSPGGSVMSGAMVIETIQGSKVPVDTICVGLCASMGAQIHAVGEHRYMTNKSVLMYHPASGGVQGEFNNMESRLAFYKRYVTKMDMFIAERAKIPYEEFKSRLRDELWLDAQDATRDGFNDRIVYLDDKRTSKEDPILSILSTQRQKRKDPMDTYFETEKTNRSKSNGIESQ